jgi:hypothetical protein
MGGVVWKAGKLGFWMRRKDMTVRGDLERKRKGAWMGG